MKTLNFIKEDSGTFMAFVNGGLMFFIVTFFGFYLIFAIIKDVLYMFTDWFWVEYLTVPFAWVDENFFLVYFGLQGLLVVVLFIFAESKSKALIVIPLYIAGFSAFILIFAQMIWGLIISLIVLRLAMPGTTHTETPEARERRLEIEKVRGWEKARTDKLAEGQYRMNVMGWKGPNWRGW